MPPKKTANRRSRKETLQEDLTKLINEWNTNDEEVFPILKEALSEGVDVNLIIDNRSLICYFAICGMLKCFEECFLLGADPTIVTSDEDSLDALVSAVSGSRSPPPILSRIVMFLLNHEKVADLHYEKALDCACEFGHFEVVRPLLRRNNSFTGKVMSWGLILGSVELVEIALEFNADVNRRLLDGRYFIHKAAELQNSSILKKLLDAGADIEAESITTNETPFQVAVRCNSVSCVRLLIDRECEISAEDALLLAIRCRSHDVLTELLKNDELCMVVREKGDMWLTAVAHDDLTAFRIVHPIVKFHFTAIHRLVRFQKYDMLSAALFEFPHPGLDTDDLTNMIAAAPNDDFKALLQKKIDAMNGVDLVAKVKEEAEEEDNEDNEK